MSKYGTSVRDGVKALIDGDYAFALANFEQLSKEGNTDALNNLGVIYEKGYGVSQNYAEAIKYYRLAAKNGCDTAYAQLASMYELGRGVPKSYTEAIKLYNIPAENGDAIAQLGLGRIYFAMSDSRAFDWYSKAAIQGNKKAQTMLGLMYISGIVVSKNESEAAKWYSLAADQGDAEAQTGLGLLYATGQGVSKNPVMAYVLAVLAAEKGNKSYIDTRDRRLEKLNDAQVEEAQRIVSKWYSGTVLPNFL